MSGLFDFMQKLYGHFGFEFRLQLSTRPEAFLGTVETWDTAEAVCVTPSPRSFPT